MRVPGEPIPQLVRIPSPKLRTHHARTLPTTKLHGRLLQPRRMSTTAKLRLLRRHKSELTQIHIDIIPHHGHILALLSQGVLKTLGLGAHAQASDVVQDLADAVELGDGLGRGAHGLQGFDEGREAREVGGVGRLDDVAEEYDDGNEGDVDDVPFALTSGYEKRGKGYEEKRKRKHTIE